MTMPLRCLPTCFALLLAVAVHASPADLSGTWLGTMDAGAMKLRLGMESITTPTGDFSVTFISIDQGGIRIPSVGPRLDEGKLTAPLPMIGGSYQGDLNEAGDTIEGFWEQGPAKLALKLERVPRLPTQNRPQEPKPPFPYDAEEVTFTNPRGGHTLAGTLTLPPTRGPHPALVLVTGSGPQDRDETLMGHKPFAVLADAITRRGVAVLRFDDRGVGKSTGDFATATSADFAFDALAAVRFLATRDDISTDRIGLGGHSEGAMVAPMVGAKFPDEVAFLLLLAPPAISGEEVIVGQGLALERSMGMPEAEATAQAEMRRKAIRAAIDSETDDEFNVALAEIVKERVASIEDGDARNEARVAYLQAFPAYRTPWFRYFLDFDPSGPLKKVACPTLALLGERDVQVLPEDNLEPLQAALEAAPAIDVQVVTLPGLNHLFQNCKTGLPAEYGTIEETIAPAALELITDWVAERAGVSP
ncbi:MAG: alpha/beta hydrolase [Planctomycetota bacterium]